MRRSIIVVKKVIMLSWLSKKVEEWARPADETAHNIYAVIAAGARNPHFYDRFGVADTLDGRFDTLTLMVVLAVRRLADAGDAGKMLGQGVVDTMFADMDLSLHEIGVSENKVGKKVKQMATAYMGRMEAYGAALAANDAAMLADVLNRNLYREDGTDAAANGLAAAVLAEEARLAALDDAVVLSAGGLDINLTGQE